MNEHEEEVKRLTALVQKVKSNEEITDEDLSELEAGVRSLDDIMDGVDELMTVLAKATEQEHQPIREYLAYMMDEKKLTYDDKRFSHLFVDRNCPGADSGASKQPRRGRDTSETVFSGYNERLVGFVVRTGKLDWGEDKIANLLATMKNNAGQG